MVKAPGIDGLGKPSGSLSHPPESSVRTQSTMGLKKRLKAAPSPLPELHPPRPTCPATRQEKHTKCSGPSIQRKSQSELSLIGEKKQHSRVTPGPGATVSSQFHRMGRNCRTRAREREREDQRAGHLSGGTPGAWGRVHARQRTKETDSAQHPPTHHQHCVSPKQKRGAQRQ